MSAGAVIVIRIKRIFSFLRERGAISLESAVAQSQVPYSDRWYFRRLVNRGVVKKVGDRCYLDEALAESYLQDRRKRAFIFLAVVILAAGACWLIWKVMK